ncbi:MAG: hypothetical protein GEU93_04155 [Propionibacteriales bacterium]|nr:hypothetical protein [Propionibacteriales bacterium]
MRQLILDTSVVAGGFEVRTVRPKNERGTEVQMKDKQSGEPLWLVQLAVLEEANGAESMITVTVAGQQPRVSPGQKVKPVRLRAIPWCPDGKSEVRIAYRAESVQPVSTSSKAA